MPSANVDNITLHVSHHILIGTYFYLVLPETGYDRGKRNVLIDISALVGYCNTVSETVTKVLSGLPWR